MEAKTILFRRSQSIPNRLRTLNPLPVWSRKTIQYAVEQAEGKDLWILQNQDNLRCLMRAIVWPVTHKMGNLLVLYHIRSETLETLSSGFKRVGLAPEKEARLPDEQLWEVLSADNKGDLAISGTADSQFHTLTLWRGDLSKIVVPFSAFARTEAGVEPNFDRFSIADYGHTIKFGNYEAAFDAVLYEFDPEYRKRLNDKRRKDDKGLGPSLRRLRLQKALRRSDFAPLTEKEIARIERGEVLNMHPRTRSIIAKRLGVPESDIESY